MSKKKNCVRKQLNQRKILIMKKNEKQRSALNYNKICRHKTILKGNHNNR